MIVEGAVVDRDGARPAYVRFRGSRVIEVGTPGTDSRRGRERRIRGIVIPAPVNGHTHLGDAVSVREPPAASLAELVRPPDGYKFRLLREASAADKVAAMTGALRRMDRDGVGATIDFREEGVAGVRALRRAARGRAVRPVILGRPLRRPIVREELAELLSVADGVGLSSALEEPEHVRRQVAEACRRRGKLFALHASEEARERPEDFLEPHPDLLVHVTRATEPDLERIAAEGSSVVVCPRSNALFGRRPRFAALERLGIPTLLGTDNAMLHAPSVWRELEFAYTSSRLVHEPVSTEFLARAVLVAPYDLLGAPEAARVEAGRRVPTLILRLPPDDPLYQIVTRTTEHLILRPGSPSVPR